MDYADDTDRKLQELVRDAQKREEQAHHEADFFRHTLLQYRAQFSGLSNSTGATPATETDGASFGYLKNTTSRQKLSRWADAHNGQIVVKELVSAVVAMGQFDTRTKAHRTMWAALAQATKRGDFERLREGVYRATSSFSAPLEHQQTEEAKGGPADTTI